MTSSPGIVPLEVVRAGAVSLGICADSLKSTANLEREPLRRFHLVAVAAPHHPLFVETTPISARALRRHVQIILTERDPEAFTAPSEGTSGGQAWRVTDLSMKLAWLRAGLGWGLMPMDWVASDLRSGRLHRLTLSSAGEARGTFVAVYPPSTPPGVAASFLLGLLR